MDNLHNSYLFDPVQVSSPGYVNEVNSCKVDEGDAGKWKGKQGSQAPGHQNELQSEVLKSTASRGRAGSGQEPRWPPPGPPPPGDAGEGRCADKASSALNGIGPAAAPQPTGDHGPQQGDRGFCVSTTNSALPTPPFPQAGGAGRQEGVLLLPPAPLETHLVQSGDPGPAFRAEGPALEAKDHDFQMPAPDYPSPRDSAGDTDDDGEEKDGVSESHPEEEPPAGTHPGVREHGLNMPPPLKRSWDSLNEAAATEALSVYFREEDAAGAAPGVGSRTGWEDAHGPTPDSSGDAVDEDAAVAEALAALEAATAGEDVDEAE
ncbi:uncharacterized protein C4orf19 homolog isoform X2 [Suricata suricatta]|uniref:Chromosome 4 open reading frame 19 n=1 Tax=Suricata suricatta TaxID=37032 RepID=A0A673SVN8_SURSU|nr:uncharacterized protein C4orf19 homolog isoform X2 [Suricata suricatta]XP_029803458.1 uncharacterized protein C4orf19 homolog isoform X2 [Suricata suricatta]